MTLFWRVLTTSRGADPRSQQLLVDAHALGVSAVQKIEIADLVAIDAPVDGRLVDLLVNPLIQQRIETLHGDLVVETALRPGVTDGRAAEVLRAAADLGIPVDSVRTGRQYAVTGALTPADQDRLIKRLLSNPVIEQYRVGQQIPFEEHHAAPVDVPAVETIHIGDLDTAALAALNTERGLALDPAELHAVQRHFADIGRDPTDAELETIGQTWSEHCAHKTFRAAITTSEGVSIRPLLKQLRDTTEQLARPFVKSAFVGNAGIIGFDDRRTFALKAETHNHPSAVEPFGGANTGVGGVIRDVMGADHQPIAVTDILCFGPLDLPADELPDGVLHPRRIAEGVIDGVADYGNKIGLPNVAGAVLYDPGYTANPLVFAGCIGVAPADVPVLDGPHPGDRVVVLGGRTGRDGIRGATFSSRTMDATTGEVEGASVQIGDPIVEKLLIDALSEARGLFSAITDCGAGGLSSAVGEMAEHTGADVDMALAPLKYSGLAPWEIWLSEAQERMVLAVPPQHGAALSELCARHGVEYTDLGSFTGDARLLVRHGATIVVDLDTRFLHDGRPDRQMTAEMPTPDRSVATRDGDSPVETLLALLGHPNIASKADVIRRYDHEIRGATLVRPLVGERLDAHADGVVLAEPFDDDGIAIGIGVNPWYGEVDPEWMAWCVVDEAIRNVVAVGGDPDAVALLDNFSWGDPRRATTLGDLAACVQGCCDASVAYDAPFVSGKDSLNNEYVASDGQRRSVPPTLVITAVAHVPATATAVTPDLKRAGSRLLLVGAHRPAFGGSHLDLVRGSRAAGGVPAPAVGALELYRRLHAAIRSGLVAACHDVSEGGIGVAVAEMCIGGGGALGATIDLPGNDLAAALFGETNGCFVVEVDPADADAFTAAVGAVTALGVVTADGTLTIDGLFEIPVTDLRAAFGADS